MRTMIMAMAMAVAACSVEGNGTTAQAVGGPGGVTVTVRAVDQLAVAWTADPAAVKYYVFRSAGGGVPAFIASVLDSGGGTPSTSYIDTGLSGGVQYCYSLESEYAGGVVSDMGAAGCGSATGGAGSTTVDIPAAAWRPRLSSGSGPVLSGDGVWSFDPAMPNEIVTDLPCLHDVATISALRFHVKRNNPIHPSVGAITVGIRGRAALATTTLAETSIGASFGTDWVTVALGPVAVGGRGAIWLSLSTGTFLGFGDPSPLFDNAQLVVTR